MPRLRFLGRDDGVPGAAGHRKAPKHAQRQDWRRLLGATSTGGEAGDTTALVYPCAPDAARGAPGAGALRLAAGRLDCIGRVCTGRAWGRPTR